MKSVELSIQGMHCDGCVRNVTQALESAGAIPERVELGRARVCFDDARLSPDAFVAALERRGFAAQVKTADGGGDQ